MSKFKMAIALAALFASATVAMAQNGQIEGAVTREDGTGIRGVSVVIEELGKAEITSASGEYRFTNVPAGSYNLSFSLGDNLVRDSVDVAADEAAVLDQSVDWDINFADTITVFSASRREERIVDAPASITVFSAEEIAAEASSGQLARVVEFAPGVELNQSGVFDFNLNARGFNSSLNRRVQTLIDGREPSVPFLGSTDWYAMSASSDVQSMELVRGPSSALYGANAFNGVLNIVTKSAQDSQGGKATLTAGNLSTIKGDLLWGGELGAGWYGKFNGSYLEGDDFYLSRVGTTEYAGLPLEAATGTNEYDGTDLSVRLDRDFTSGLFTVEGGVYEGFGGTAVTGIGRVQVNDLERTWLRANLSTPHFNVLAYNNEREAPNQLALASGGRIFLDSSQTKVEAQANGTFAGGKGRIVGGLSYKEEEVDTANGSGFQTLMFQAVSEDYSAAFAQVDYDISDRVKLVVAGRFDDSSLHDSQFSPKAALVFGLNDSNTLRVSYNEAFQVPNYSEFFLDAPTAIPGVGAFVDLRGIEALVCAPFGVDCGFGSITGVKALGNVDLELEEITSFEVGYQGILSDKAYLTVDYYSNELSNFISDLTSNLVVGPTGIGFVNPNFGGYTPPSAHPLPDLLVGTLQGALGPLFGFLSNNVDGTPIFALASYGNAGQVDSQGIDVGLNYYATPNWTIDFSYSWFDFEIKDTGGFAESNLLANAPEGKAAVGVTYRNERAMVSLKGRWVDDFEWSAGAFRGPVESYETFSLTGTYDATDAITVGVNISNLFDDEHYQSFGGDLLTQRALGYVTFNW